MGKQYNYNKISEQKKQDIIKETLEWCNRKRQEMGLEPFEKLPKGRRYDAVSCPCGKATGLHVEGYGYFTLAEWRNEANKIDKLFHGIPETVKVFIGCFDRGLIPELVIE